MKKIFENNNSVWQGGKLHLEPEQEKGELLSGEVLFERLKDKAYNTKVLDYLLEHQEEIPEEWKGKLVYFWGTKYEDSDGYLHVHCLFWGGDRWNWRCIWLGNDFSGSNPAAIPASLDILPQELIINNIKYKRI